MNKFLYIIICFILTGCTYSITMAHTQGEATDLIDETTSNTPRTSISPTVSIPASVI